MPFSALNSIPTPLPSLSSPFVRPPIRAPSRIGILVVSNRCSELVYKWSVRSVLLDSQPFLVRTSFPPSPSSVKGGLFRGRPSYVRLHDFILFAYYLRQARIYDLILTGSFDSDIECICTFELNA
jgi:hypothetical protein